ncbi:FadR/GntR family transcriptional regulator [Mesorhizobium sp.]|uniref:FadR/GntR family transcriptional regulator n=1 Tax=Mesorhizobium sp. TaxID=1871066 RepID=UPI0025CC9309|nr:FadR/GntR family transcriptional regulator [Mesorhizobium sp.]
MTKRIPLSTVVAESLSEDILSGELRPGTQLPTEAELCAEYDVSRTVVREAIARLRSEGLVIPRQGLGMFVSEAPAPYVFSIPEAALGELPQTLALLELRLGVEVEAAGLCAERRSDDEAAGIRAIMEQADGLREDPAKVPLHYDHDFHLAIANAARNRFIHGFLSYLHPIIGSRVQLGHLVAAEVKDSYYARIHAEHEGIVRAIEKRNGRVARDSMRRHLHDSFERVRALALASRAEVGNTKQVAAVDLIRPIVR